MSAGKMLTVEVYGAKGDRKTTRAFTTLADGLVVHESLRDPGWCATHRRSGLMLVMFDDPEQAQAFCADLVGVIDWTQPGAAIVEDPKVAPAVRAARSARGYVPSSAGVAENLDARAERLRA